MAPSKVAEFRQQQAAQEEAAQLGLNGLASGISRHAFIEAKIQQGAEYILQLIQEGRHEEAQRLMATKAWGQKSLEGIEEGENEIYDGTIKLQHTYIP